MKRCFKCGEAKPLADFYLRPEAIDGHRNGCKECTKRDVKRRYAANPEKMAAYERRRFREPTRKQRVVEYKRAYRDRCPDKHHARTAIRSAVRAGRLARQPCAVCGTREAVEAHHDDYTRPLDVRWLCFRHHRETHGQRVNSQVAS